MSDVQATGMGMKIALGCSRMGAGGSSIWMVDGGGVEKKGRRRGSMETRYWVLRLVSRRPQARGTRYKQPIRF